MGSRKGEPQRKGREEDLGTARTKILKKCQRENGTFCQRMLILRTWKVCMKFSLWKDSTFLQAQHTQHFLLLSSPALQYLGAWVVRVAFSIQLGLRGNYIPKNHKIWGTHGPYM